MCFFCSISNPSDPLAGFDQHLGEAGSGGGYSNAPFTWDQIANQLTDGYWGSTAGGGGDWRAFDLGGTRTLTYDIANLSAGAQTVALAALEAWSEVTGITFTAVSTPSTTVVNEGADAQGGTGTSYVLGATMTRVNGTIDFAYDVDYYRVSLVAGQTYMISAQGNGLDLVLSLMNASNVEVGFSDYAYDSGGEYITFTATSSGNHYINISEWGDYVGNYTLTIEQVTADITFNDMDPEGAYAFSDLSGNEILRSFINIHDSWDTLNLNGYMLQTYIHELGHALGLGHAGNYNGDATWGVDNHYDNDSWAASVMSYFDQIDNPNFAGDLAYLASLMPADIIAIQDLYGFSGTTNAGATTYGYNSNMGGYLQNLLNMWTGAIATNASVYAGEPIAFTVFDSDGIDTINFSNFAAHQTINLNQLAYSSVGGLSMNMIIARGTVIENANGGSGNDTITGNAVANILNGNNGNDRFEGGLGNDTINGGNGTDTAVMGVSSAGITVTGNATTLVITSSQGTDTYTGVESFVFTNGTLTAAQVLALIGSGSTTPTGGNDTLTGTAGADTINGLAGNDSISGLGGNDALIGAIGSDTLRGGDGNDTLQGGAGADVLDGGTNTDIAVYWDSDVGLVVDMFAPTGNTGIAIGDSFVSVENLAGSNHSDTLRGDALANVILGYAGNDIVDGRGGDDSLEGGDGNDTLIGGAGADRMVGGLGIDLVAYWDASTGVTADFLNPSINAGIALGDTYGQVENLAGSNHSDYLRGTQSENLIIGFTGEDRLEGRGGADTLNAGEGNDTVLGGAGADVLVGGTGNDLAAYWDSVETGVIASLLDPTINSGFAAGDTYSEIENLAGTNFGDLLAGNDSANHLIGFGGNDSLYGFQGNDTLTGGAGNDTLYGEQGNDVLWGEAGQDSFMFITPLGATNVDLIRDFSSVDDTIVLENYVFSTLGEGALAGTALAFGTAATTGAHRVIYDQTTGRIFYDADGNGAGGQVHFATVTAGTALVAADFLVI